jgi:hypothetical protein
MKRGRIFGFAILCSLLPAAFFWIEQEQEKILDPGEALPVMKYITRSGPQTLTADSTRVLLLLYFNRTCEHCIYQLDQFDSNMDRFTDQNFIFLTGEMRFLAAGGEQQWIRLSTRDNVRFGIVQRNEFLDAFGTAITPSIFIFDRKGILRFREQHEIRIEKIEEILGKHTETENRFN